MTVPEPTARDAERERRIRDFQQRVETALRDNLHIWHQTPTRFDYAAEIVVDALGDQAAELLANQTMLKGLRIENGIAILDTEPARELMLVMVASLRTMLDDHGAENYLEMEIKAPCIAVDLQDGQHPEDAYTVTIQRRYRPTAHEFRQRAERERDQLREDVRYLLGYEGPRHAHLRPGIWDDTLAPCAHCARLDEIRKHLGEAGEGRG